MTTAVPPRPASPPAPAPAPAPAATIVDDDTPSMASFLVPSVAVATLLTFAVVAGSLLAFYGEVPQALVVGTFVGFWAGPGSGLIAGIALYNLRVERLAAARAGLSLPGSG